MASEIGNIRTIRNIQIPEQGFNGPAPFKGDLATALRSVIREKPSDTDVFVLANGKEKPAIKSKENTPTFFEQVLTKFFS